MGGWLVPSKVIERHLEAVGIIIGISFGDEVKLEEAEKIKK